MIWCPMVANPLSENWCPRRNRHRRRCHTGYVVLNSRRILRHITQVPSYPYSLKGCGLTGDVREPPERHRIRQRPSLHSRMDTDKIALTVLRCSRNPILCGRTRPGMVIPTQRDRLGVGVGKEFVGT